ncbi:MAG: ATP-binding protein, partial [Pseudomonadales bacterium]
HAANDCMSDSFARPYQGELEAESVTDIEASIALALGQATSSREVSLALAELSLGQDERRPHALRQIRHRIESNLSTLMGQTIAHRIIGHFVPYKAEVDLLGYENIHTIESRLEDYRSQLTGMAAELDALRRYHRQILQDLPTAVCSINKDWQVLTWNGAMEDLSWVSADKIVGSSLVSLPEEWYKLLHGFASGNDVHALKSVLHIDGQNLILNLHKASIANMPAAQGDVVIVIENITEETMLEEKLIHSERLASIGQLAAGVAHEIGNPITGIACLAQNLKIETNRPELIELSNQILEQTERISAILHSLVNFSYGGNADLKRPSVPVNIHQCVDEAIKLLSLSQVDKGIAFANLCPADMKVLGDPQRLAQVFVNILTNARDASRPGSQVAIEAGMVDDHVEITVVDQGHGISQAHLKQVFEPFFTTKDPGQGTGLGLAIVSSIVEEHHGSITAEPATDGGTRVIIKLPGYESSGPELTSTANS